MGSLQLGEGRLSLDTLNHYAPQLQNWFSSSSSTLHLYACNLAAGDAGTEFLTKLHHLTGASIAASAEVVGNFKQGGTWQLTAHRGTPTPEVAFDASVTQHYTGVFAVSFGSATDFAVSGSNPFDLEIGDFNGDGNADLVTVNLSSDNVSVLLNTTVGITNVNDAPTGSATAALFAGTEDTAYTITKAQLLDGFNDVDGNALSIKNFTTSNGSFVENLDGSFTITPVTNSNGLATVNYQVSDGALSVAASNSFNLAAVNDAPTLTGTKATLVAGVEDTNYTITTSQLLAGFTDVDNATFSVANVKVGGTALSLNAANNYVFTPEANANGNFTVTYDITDGIANTAATLDFSFAAVNDAPTLTGTKATLAAGIEDTNYTIKATELLTGFSDVDGDTLSVDNLSTSNG